MINIQNNYSEVISDLKETISNIYKIKKYNCSQNIYRWLNQEEVFSKISEVYPFTNELMKEYNSQIDLNGKKILTVTSSGDQIITAMLKNASLISTFDCNKLTYYHLFFKIAAILALSYEEFISLYTIIPDVFTSTPKKLYEKIREYIYMSDVKFFWDILFKKNDEIFNLFFLCANCKPENYNIEYIDKAKFNITKRKIHENVFFENINVYDVAKIYKDYKYDFINLSNIMNYQKNKVKYAKFIKSLMENNLNDNGVILANYIWNNTPETDKEIKILIEEKCNPEIVLLNEKKLIFKNINFSSHVCIDSNIAVFCKKK